MCSPDLRHSSGRASHFEVRERCTILHSNQFQVLKEPQLVQKLEVAVLWSFQRWNMPPFAPLPLFMTSASPTYDHTAAIFAFRPRFPSSIYADMAKNSKQHKSTRVKVGLPLVHRDALLAGLPHGRLAPPGQVLLLHRVVFVVRREPTLEFGALRRRRTEDPAAGVVSQDDGSIRRDRLRPRRGQRQDPRRSPALLPYGMRSERMKPASIVSAPAAVRVSPRDVLSPLLARGAVRRSLLSIERSKRAPPSLLPSRTSLLSSRTAPSPGVDSRDPSLRPRARSTG
mmetsp:Transcript_23950/g.51241  ORF Transcript_23950/g.51241 Transcript_23950/m.51241 type:complete len:284 (-) Transcript_23950:334-1185(-)